MKTDITYLEEDCRPSDLKSTDILLNICNCRCEWRGAWQSSLKVKYQNAYIADLNTRKGDTSKLGKVTWAKERSGLYIANAYCHIEHNREPLGPREESFYRALKVIDALFPKGRLIVPIHAFADTSKEVTAVEQQVLSVFKGREVVFYNGDG